MDHARPEGYLEIDQDRIAQVENVGIMGDQQIRESPFAERDRGAPQKCRNIHQGRNQEQNHF